jgi:hypothetical protein
MRSSTALIGSGYSPSVPTLQQWNNNDSTPAPASFHQYVWATTFCFLTAGLWYLWSISLINTVHVDGIPQLGTTPSYGNVYPFGYLTSRYGWDYWCIQILGWNAALPMTLAFALANNKVDTWRSVHAFFAKWLIFANFVIFLILSWRWLVYCNTPYSAMQSACNDFRWCGAGWPSPWCPNGGPFTPPVSFSDLSRNFEMQMHWIFSLVFLVLACWHLSQNQTLVMEGVLE